MREVPLAESSLIESTTVGDLEVLCSVRGHAKALLYFHGFPGPAVPLPLGERRVIDALYSGFCEEHDFYYPLYTKPINRMFSFDHSLQDAEIAARVLRSSFSHYSSITIIGQSYGAVMAARITPSLPGANFILLTPFLGVREDQHLLKLVQGFHKLYPSFVTRELVQPYFEQLKELSQSLRFDEAFSEISNLNVLAAERDEIVPLSAVERMVGALPKARLRVLANQTHALEDRQQLKTALMELVR